MLAVLGEPEQADVDPLDVSQWRFYVLATEALNRRLGDQETLSLGPLRRLEPEGVLFGDIGHAVARVVAQTWRPSED